MVRDPVFDHAPPPYSLNLDVIDSTVVPLIFTVTGPVFHQDDVPPPFDFSVQLMVLVLFATDCVALHWRVRPMSPLYLFVFSVPLRTLASHTFDSTVNVFDCAHPE